MKISEEEYVLIINTVSRRIGNIIKDQKQKAIWDDASFSERELFIGSQISWYRYCVRLLNDTDFLDDVLLLVY